MKIFVRAAIVVVAFAVALMGAARATMLTRFYGVNHSGHCARFGLQEKGPYGIAWYGPFKNNERWDHVNNSGASEQPEYYLEWTVDDCATHKVLYRDFAILKPALHHSFEIVPSGKRYVLIVR